MEENSSEINGGVTTMHPDQGRKLCDATQSAVLNVLYNNLQKTIIDCVARGSSLLLSITDETPKLQSLPGRAVVSLPGDVQVVSLSKDIRNILMNQAVYLKGAASSTEEEGVEFRKELILDPLKQGPHDHEAWNCVCFHCSTGFSRACPLLKDQVEKIEAEKKKPKTKKRVRLNNPRRVRVKCQYCGKIITNQSLKFHMEAHQGKRYQCRQCPKDFKNPFSRNRHEKIHTHGHDKTITCPHCPKSFYTIGAFNVHLNSKHRKIERHFCDTCNKGFYFKNELLLHQTLHTGEKSHICPDCGRGFRTKNQMNLHIKFHSKTAERQATARKSS